MNKEHKRPGLWLALAALALGLSLSGCEQILGKENSGDFGGSDLIVDSPARSAAPEIRTVNKGIALTWTVPSSPALTYMTLFRRSPEDSRENEEYDPIALITRDPLEEEELPAQKTLQYIDYYTVKDVEYIYFISGGTMRDDSVRFETRDTDPVKGLTQDDALVTGDIKVSYDSQTGIVTFDPALPEIPASKYPGLGVPKAGLQFDNGTKVGQLLTFTPQLSSIDLTTISFNPYFDVVSEPISMAYQPVYENQTDGVYVITYMVGKGVTITGKPGTEIDEYGWIINITLPEVKHNALDAPEVEPGATSSSTVLLVWDEVEGASQYRVYRNGERIFQTTGFSYQDTGLTPETEYVYQVAAYNGTEGAKSEEVKVTTESVTQDISEGQDITNTLSTGETHYYRFTPAAGSSYDIVWEDADNSSSYSANILVGVKAETKDSPTYVVPLTNATPDNIISVPASNTATYFIVVKAVTGGRYSIEYSSRRQQEEEGPPPMPSNLRVNEEETTAYTISLAWDTVEGAAYYRIYRGDDEYLTQTSGTTFTMTGLTPNTTYTYQVSAVNSATGEGEKATVTVTTKSATSETTYIPLTSFPTANVVSEEVPEHYYRFYGHADQTYQVNWTDKDSGVSGYGDIKVSARSGSKDGVILVLTTDYGNRIIVTPSSDGYVVIVAEVYSRTSSRYGEYSIYYTLQ